MFGHVLSRLVGIRKERTAMTLEGRAERILRPTEASVPRGRSELPPEYDPVLRRFVSVDLVVPVVPHRAGRERRSVHPDAELRNLSKILLGRNPIIKRGAILDGRTHHAEHGIECGDDFYAKEYVYLDAYGGFIRLGRGAALAQGVAIHGNGGVRVGDYLMMGHGAMILAGNHRHAVTGGLPFMFQGSTARGIEVGSNVWLGAGAIVLDGTTIGDNVVIGAGTVVSRDIPSDSMVTSDRQVTIESLSKS